MYIVAVQCNCGFSGKIIICTMIILGDGQISEACTVQATEPHDSVFLQTFFLCTVRKFHCLEQMRIRNDSAAVIQTKSSLSQSLK